MAKLSMNLQPQPPNENELLFGIFGEDVGRCSVDEVVGRNVQKEFCRLTLLNIRTGLNERGDANELFVGEFGDEIVEFPTAPF